MIYMQIYRIKYIENLLNPTLPVEYFFKSLEDLQNMLDDTIAGLNKKILSRSAR